MKKTGRKRNNGKQKDKQERHPFKRREKKRKNKHAGIEENIVEQTHSRIHCKMWQTYQMQKEIEESHEVTRILPQNESENNVIVKNEIVKLGQNINVLNAGRLVKDKKFERKIRHWIVRPYIGKENLGGILLGLYFVII